MFDDFNKCPMIERMDFIMNTRLEPTKKDSREVEVFGSQPVDLIIFTNPAGCFDELD
jgi:hypothetical protein